MNAKTQSGNNTPAWRIASNFGFVSLQSLAWAHDWADSSALNAVFQALPGACLVVNGAADPN